MRLDLGPLLRSTLGQALVVALLTACCVLPGISTLPVIDRDEARFVQATRQMLDSHDWHGFVVPRFGDQLRLQKPPAIYWVQSAAVIAAGGHHAGDDAIWMYRLPGALAAILTALVTWHLGRRMFGAVTGTLAGVFMGVCPLVAFDAHQARADEVMVAVTTLLMVVTWHLWTIRRGGVAWGSLLAAYALCGAGVLLKGPITPFVFASTVVCMAAATREWRWLLRLQPWLGVTVIAAMVLPWLMQAAHEIGGDTVWGAIRREVFERAGGGMEGHWAPPGYHLVLLPVLFFPGSLLTALAIPWAWRRARRTRVAAPWWKHLALSACSSTGRHPELFLLCWLLPTWIVFECIATKLPHYVLPCYPAVALLSARVVVGGVGSVPRALDPINRFGYGVWAVIGACLAWAPTCVVVACDRAGLLNDEGLSWSLTLRSPAFVITVCIGAFGSLLMWRARRDALDGRFWDASRRGIALAVVSLAWTLGALLPRVPAPWITDRTMARVWREVARRGGDQLPPLAAVGYTEDSLLFASGGAVERTTVALLPAWMEAHANGLVIATPDACESLHSVAPQSASRLMPTQESVVRGFNYSKGRVVEVQLYAVGAAPGG